MFERITDLWERRGFEIVFWASIIFIIFCMILRIGKQGSYDKDMWSYPSMYTSGLLQQPQKAPQDKPKDSRGETTCRKYLEMRFNKPFDKIRPDFLRNPVTSGGKNGDYNLELDCFNPDLKLALEYNGIQHYKYVPYFHRSKETFHNQKYRDEIKKYKCRENGINLIEVPYDVKDIHSFIEKELRKLGY